MNTRLVATSAVLIAAASGLMLAPSATALSGGSAPSASPLVQSLQAARDQGSVVQVGSIASPSQGVISGVAVFNMRDDAGDFRTFATVQGGELVAVAPLAAGTDVALVRAPLAATVPVRAERTSPTTAVAALGTPGLEPFLMANEPCGLINFIGKLNVATALTISLICDVAYNDGPPAVVNPKVVYWPSLEGRTGVDEATVNGEPHTFITDTIAEPIYNNLTGPARLNFDLHILNRGKRIPVTCSCTLTGIFDAWSFYNVEEDATFESAAVSQYFPYSGEIRLGQAVRAWTIEP